MLGRWVGQPAEGETVIHQVIDPAVDQLADFGGRGVGGLPIAAEDDGSQPLGGLGGDPGVIGLDHYRERATEVLELGEDLVVVEVVKEDEGLAGEVGRRDLSEAGERVIRCHSLGSDSPGERG